MKALVTGGDLGFIGSTLVRLCLLKLGYEVIVIDMVVMGEENLFGIGEQRIMLLI